MTKKSKQYISLVLLFIAATTNVAAQGIFDALRKNRKMAASNYYAYPTPATSLTPAPKGKKPFYISHYGRHGSRYLSQRKGYDIPFNYLHKGDSLGKLSDTGKKILKDMESIIKDAEGYWGTLTPIGTEQLRGITQRMMDRFPQVFNKRAVVDARSTIVNRCILSMATTMNEIAARHPNLKLQMQAAPHDMDYLNFQDKGLRDSMLNLKAKRAFDSYVIPFRNNQRVTDLLFNDTAYSHHHVDSYWLPYYLLKTGLMQQNTKMCGDSIIALFSDNEIHDFWKQENAWWYICYGPTPIHNERQPYSQRVLLRHIIECTDSCIKMEHPGATLRFGHETVLLPLVCLLGLNSFDFVTDNLGELEANNWWACRVFPMGANIQFVFYRKNRHDTDVLFKVLLNEEEATLPLPTDHPPYYRWKDFREYYLKKLDNYKY